jgi:hypothetical protein
MIKLTQWSLFWTNQMKYGLLTNYQPKFWEFKRPQQYRGMTEIYSWKEKYFSKWWLMITTDDYDSSYESVRFTQQTNINMTIKDSQRQLLRTLISLTLFISWLIKPSNQQTITNNQQSTTNDKQLTTSNQQPVTNNQRPMTNISFYIINSWTPF